MSRRAGSPGRIGMATLIGLLAAWGQGAGTAMAWAEPPYTTAQSAQPSQDLGLSEAQLKQFQAISERHKQDLAAQRRIADEFQRLVTADKVDVPALTRHLTESRQVLQKSVNTAVAALVETRAVLTAEQRQKFARMTEAQQAPPDRLGDLQLTPRQRQAVESLQTDAVMATLSKALADFMRTGNRPALETAVKRAFTQLPPPKQMAEVLASLSLEQRKRLVGVD